jgi:hypothetical protein
LKLQTASRDTQILGHFIPKGTEIILHIGHAGIHDTVENASKAEGLNAKRGHNSRRATQQWKDDGTKFDPDRWMSHGTFDPNSGLALPFGGGARMCFGYKLAVRKVFAQRNSKLTPIAAIAIEACIAGDKPKIRSGAASKSQT